MFKKSASRNLFTALFAFLTVGIMALFFSIYEPWQPIGPELIPDGSFSTPEATNGWNGWSQQAQLVPDGGYGESPGVVLTTSSNEHGLLRFTVNDLTNIPAFRVSLRATAQGIVQGKENYHLPRALFFYRDANSKGLFNLHHGILAITKDTGWRYYKDFFPVPENAINAQMYIQNLGVAGVMHADDVSVIPVRARPSAPWWKLFFGTLWTAAFGFCLSALRPWNRRYGFMIMATLVLILTGITLPGEVRGILNKVKDWSKVSIAQIPMGHGIAVTRLQMVYAMAAIANDGWLMHPLIISRLQERDGSVVQRYAPERVRQVISPTASRQMIEALKAVVTKDGTAPGAALKNYVVAGKTGTAQKAENGGYASGKYVSSFIGFLPADNPELCISVVMDEPKEGYYGGRVCGPVFKDIAERCASYLNIPPDPNLMTNAPALATDNNYRNPQKP